MPDILITGANRGLGLEFARQYAAGGWDVIATCRNPADAADLRALAEVTGRITVEPLDVTDHAGIDALAAKYRGRPLDVLLNNAGIIGPIPIADHIAKQRFGTIDYGTWELVLRTNTLAPVKMAEAFLENVLAGEQKKICTISSTIGSIAERDTAAFAYGSSKAAVNKAMTMLAGVLRERGVIVALFCPGYVQTRMDMGGADVTPEQSITGLRSLIDTLTLADSGSFRRYNGERIAW
jgi:NAD(P)-dependent dehydrogenase (short-subunit alcohol dehydrogenase family)